MTSNIIIMAERIKDETDRALEQLFRSGPIDDDGFSDRVMLRVRRHVWVRRLAMPVALVIGALVGLKPLLDSVAVLSALFSPLAEKMMMTDGISLAFLADLPTLLVGIMLAASVLMIGRMLEE